jgi:predicted transcriptional regulator
LPKFITIKPFGGSAMRSTGYSTTQQERPGMHRKLNSIQNETNSVSRYARNRNTSEGLVEAAPFVAGGASNTKKSAMIEKEMKEIQRIKDKQKKEVTQMIDLEMKMNLIKAKNEQNMIK